MCAASGVGRSPTPDRPSFGACGRGPLPTRCGCGSVGVETRHQLHGARSCELALPAVGAAPGRPGGLQFLPGCGASGGRRSPAPDRPFFWDVRPGLTTHWLWVREVWAWGPVTNPTARALASWLSALWGPHEGARGGGGLLPGGRGSGVGRSPTPDRLSFGGCGPGPLPTGCECGGCRREDPSPTPQRALLQAGFARCGGGMRAPKEGRVLPVCVASRVERSPTPDRPSFGACGRGPLPTGCGCGWCGRGDRSPTPQRALLRAGFAGCGGGTRAPGGRRLLPGCGASGVGRSPTPNRPSFAACGRGPLPTGWGCGWCGRGDPSPTPQRALLRAGFARCGGGTRAPRGGGASCLGVGRAGSGALPPPTACPLGRVAGAHHPLAVGAGGVGVETRHQPHSARSGEMALRAAEAARGHPGGGGASCLCVGRLGSGTLPPPATLLLGRGGGVHYPLDVGAGVAGLGTCHQLHSARSCELALRAVGAARGRLGLGRPGSGALPPPTGRLMGRAAGAQYPLALGAWGVGLGTRHQPHSARSCELALRAVGAARGCPGGAPLACVCGVRGQALSHPRLPVLWGVWPGPTIHWLSVPGGVGVGTRHQPHSARSCELALPALGAARGRPGRAPLTCVWGVRGRALSHPRPPVFWGVRPRPTTHWLWVRGVRAWAPVTKPKERAPASWLWALWGRHGDDRGGGTSGLGVRRPGSGTLPTPTARPLGPAAGAHYPLVVGAGGVGVGTRHQPHSARSCELALRAVGAARGCPGGAPLACAWGVRGRALSHPRPPFFWGVRPGPTTYWLWVRGVWACGPVSNPTEHARASWLCRLWGRQEGAREGVASCLGTGRPE